MLDTSKPQVAIIQAAQAAAAKPLIPLGTVGTFDSTKWTTIGYLRRQSQDKFTWAEYLLFNSEKGYRWLVEADGHWTSIATLNKTPKIIGTSRFVDKQGYQDFATYESKVIFVIGEFYWKVRAGDSADVVDFIAPPCILSSEKTKKEVSWSMGTYLTPEQIQTAFALKTALPEPKGVAPHQINPHIENAKIMWRWFGLFTVIALVVQIYFALNSATVLTQDFAFKAGADSNVLSKPFKITNGDGAIRIAADTTLENGVASLSYTLIDKKTGATYRSGHELSFYSGTEDGESWKEGDASGAVVIDVPPGEYMLNVEGDMAVDAAKPGQTIGAKIRVQSGHASWLNWILVLLALLVMPLMASWRRSSFETARWAGSDKAGDDDDD